MIKIIGFLLCAASLFIFSSRYNRQMGKRLLAYSAVLSLLTHIKDKMLAYPDTLHRMLDGFEAPSDIAAELAAALSAPEGARQNLPVQITESMDGDDLDRLRAFSSEFGKGYLDSERQRCDKIFEHFDARHSAVREQTGELRRLSSVLLACAIGGLLMLTI